MVLGLVEAYLKYVIYARSTLPWDLQQIRGEAATYPSLDFRPGIEMQLWTPVDILKIKGLSVSFYVIFITVYCHFFFAAFYFTRLQHMFLGR